MSERPTLSRLAASLRIAAMEVPVGSFWAHYKEGDVYEVTDLSIEESSGEIKVVYRPAPVLEEARYEGLVNYSANDDDLTGLSFTRPFSDWFEQVRPKEGADWAVLPRFARVHRIQVYAHAA